MRICLPLGVISTAGARLWAEAGSKWIRSSAIRVLPGGLPRGPPSRPKALPPGVPVTSALRCRVWIWMFGQGTEAAFQIKRETLGRWESLLLTAAQFSSVAQLCPTICDPMDCSMPGLSITNYQSLLKLMSIESVMPSSHLILCRPLLLLPPKPPSIRVFSNESALRMMRPKDPAPLWV